MEKTEKEIAKELAEEFVRKMNEPTAENALQDMKISQMLFLTKNGDFYSTIANEYLKILQTNRVYCKEEKQDEWNKKMKSLINHIGKIDDDSWLFHAWVYEKVGIFLEKLSKNCSWSEIDKMVHEQGHSGYSISYVSQMLLEFSPKGIEFVENIVKPTGSLKLLENLKSSYNCEKRRRNINEKRERKELGLRLVKSLNQRMNYLNNWEK